MAVLVTVPWTVIASPAVALSKLEKVPVLKVGFDVLIYLSFS
jgi:hypothetical protein